MDDGDSKELPLKSGFDQCHSAVLLFDGTAFSLSCCFTHAKYSSTSGLMDVRCLDGIGIIPSGSSQ